MNTDEQQPKPDDHAVEEPIRTISRKQRKRIDHTDCGHTCSPNHIRVPAHCRLKRGKKKRPAKEPAISQTL